MSTRGGINFKSPTSIKNLDHYNRSLEKLQHQYQIIYELLGGEKGKAPDLSQPEIRRPIISCLKKSLAQLDGILYNAGDYMLCKDASGNIRIGVEPEIIFIHSGIHGLVNLYTSDVVKKILAI